MRKFASYLLAGLLGAVAMELIAAPFGLDRAVGARPVVDSRTALQIVDRTHKGDRLKMPAAIGMRQTPDNPALSKPSPVLVGCDPVFSSLSAAARLNTAGRCIS